MRKATRRQVRSPRMNPVALALLAGPTAKEGLNTLQLAEAEALAGLKAGTASDWDLQWLRRMLAVAPEMARAGIGPEALQACETARTALGQITRTSTGWLLEDVTPLAELQAWHQAQREAGSAADYTRGLHAAKRHSTRSTGEI